MALACALGLDRVADLLSRADPLTRAFWRVILGRADHFASLRDERIANLIARSLGG